jgi:hypothetical protein
VLSTPPAFVLSQDQTLRECLPTISGSHITRAVQEAEYISPHTASSLCCFFKGTTSPEDTIESRASLADGVSTYLALTFSTLLSSQGTDTSFVLTTKTFSAAFLRAFPFGVFVTLSDCLSVV